MGYIEEFMEFLSIPSIGTMPEYKQDTLKAAEWLRARMEKAGVIDTAVVPTGGQPTVYGYVPARAPGAKTVLIYGHYDVQPPDPLDQWVSPPFKPEIRDGKIFARGASDNKGGVFAGLAAVEGMIQAGGPPVNIKFLYEGEEESGSPNVEALLKEHKGMFSADLAISVDGGGGDPGVPVVSTGSKGICGIEIEVTGAERDLHSGQAGQVVNNPLNALCAIVASMKYPDGKIAVKGFYDDVVAISPDEKKAFAQVPGMDTESLKKAYGAPDLFGESDYTPVERAFARPTLDLNGMWGGFMGSGLKTVIPAKAYCKITCRLVHDQDPKKIAELLVAHVKANTPKGVTVKATPYGMGVKAYLIPYEHAAVQACIRVKRGVYKREPIIVRSGGTLPISRIFLDNTGAYLIAFATQSSDERVHAPNEFFRVEEFEMMRKGLPLFMEEIARTM